METNNSSSPSGDKPKETPVLTSILSKKPGIKSKKVRSKKTDWIETLVKVAGPLLTASGLFLGAWQFQRQQGTNNEQEFKRRIWEKRLEAYMEIGTLTGKLITTPAGASFDSLQRRFEQAYWGKMPLVEDDGVAYQMKLVNEELQLLQLQQGYRSVLKTRSLRLMQACHQSLYTSWNNIEENKPLIGIFSSPSHSFFGSK